MAPPYKNILPLLPLSCQQPQRYVYMTNDQEPGNRWSTKFRPIYTDFSDKRFNPYPVKKMTKRQMDRLKRVDVVDREIEKLKQLRERLYGMDKKSPKSMLLIQSRKIIDIILISNDHTTLKSRLEKYYSMLINIVRFSRHDKFQNVKFSDIFSEADIDDDEYLLKDVKKRWERSNGNGVRKKLIHELWC
jgi:hypothetical protein